MERMIVMIMAFFLAWLDSWNAIRSFKKHFYGFGTAYSLLAFLWGILLVALMLRIGA